jgi:hypothetical protein
MLNTHCQSDVYYAQCSHGGDDPVTAASVAGHSMSSIVIAIAASIPKIVQSKGCVCACDTTITVSAVAGSDSCSSKRSSKTSITRPWH